MKKNKTISLILGFFISGLFNCLVYIILIIYTFDILRFNLLIDPESVHAKLFYTGFAMTILTVLIIYLLLKQQKKFFSIGIGLPSLIGVFLMLKFGLLYFNKSNYYETFDKNVWNKSKIKQIKMARVIVKDSVLIGLTKEEVFKMLGEEQVSSNNDSTEYLRYWTENNVCALGIVFINGKVKHANLWVDD